MRIPRVFTAAVPDAEGRIELDAQASRHLLRALRLQTGAPVTAFDGTGVEYDTRLERAGKDRAVLVVAGERTVGRESPLTLTLVQGICRGERMDYTVQKATELGVARIVPVACARTTVRLDAERARKRHRHWHGVMVSACEQCGRAQLPQLDPVQSLEAWLADPGRATARLMLDPGAARGLRDLPESPEVMLLAGPEGGLNERERSLAAQGGFAGVHLGPRVLRTETAAVVAITAVQTLWGDLG